MNLDTQRLGNVRAYSTVAGRMEVGSVKTHEKRTVPIPASVAEELRPLLNRRSPVHRSQERSLTAAELPVERVRQGPARAGLGDKGVAPHKLRHTAASLAIASGADVKVVQTMLGHKSATMTLDIYGHLFPDRLDEVASRLDDQRELLLLAKQEKRERLAEDLRLLLAQHRDEQVLAA